MTTETEDPTARTREWCAYQLSLTKSKFSLITLHVMAQWMKNHRSNGEK